MSSNYIYRCFKSTWGIYVGLTADIVPLEKYNGNSSEILPGIYLSIEVPNFPAAEERYFVLAIKIARIELENKLKGRLPVVIRIISLEIALTDYEPPGLTYALVGWMEQELGRSVVLLQPQFDKKAINIFSISLHSIS